MKLNSFIGIMIFSLGFSACEKDTPAVDDPSEIGTIIEGDKATIKTDTKWEDRYKDDTIDYYVKELVRIVDNATLTIEPGVRIAFETAESGIRIEDNASLIAQGETSKPIIFTSRNQSEGVWKGIIFASENANNKLDYVEVKYAGSMIDEGYCDALTSIGLANNKNAKLSITNTNIGYSGGYGLWVAGTADVDLKFAKNLIENCEDAPVALTADNMAKLDSLSYFHSNYPNKYIDVYNVIGAEITDDATLQALDVPYRISGRIHILKTLTISHGCILEFNTDGEITTTNYSKDTHTGVIKAEGIPGDTIIFRGVQSVPGSWIGITITSSGSNNFVLCKISDGGASTGFANPTAAKGNIIVGRSEHGATANIKYCQILNSAAYGIARYKDLVTPDNSSKVTTSILISGDPFSFYLETNKFSNNTLTNYGDYSD